MKKNITYTQAINQVEQILQKLDSKDFDIDTLAENVKVATSLLAICKQKLHKAQEDVEQIIQEQQ